MDAETKKALEKVKCEINATLEEIAKQCPELADHLRKHIVFNEEKGTVCYTGDIEWNTLSPPGI